MTRRTRRHPLLCPRPHARAGHDRDAGDVAPPGQQPWRCDDRAGRHHRPTADHCAGRTDVRHAGLTVWPGDATIAEGQNGDDGVLRLGTANDHDNQFVPGLTQELLDSSNAFAKWCNEQGGIKGPADRDHRHGRPHHGGGGGNGERPATRRSPWSAAGMVLDDQEFPRFNECGMIDFAGLHGHRRPKRCRAAWSSRCPTRPTRRPRSGCSGRPRLPGCRQEHGDRVRDIDTTANVADQLEAAMNAPRVEGRDSHPRRPRRSELGPVRSADQGQEGSGR